MGQAGKVALRCNKQTCRVKQIQIYGVSLCLCKCMYTYVNIK